MLKIREYNCVFLVYTLCLELAVFLWNGKLEMGKWASKLKIYGTMLKSPQVNALILIFHMAGRAVTMIYWLMCLEMKVTNSFSRLHFPHTRFYKTIARLSLKGTLWEQMYFLWFNIQIYWVHCVFALFQIVYGFIETDKDKQM